MKVFLRDVIPEKNPVPGAVIAIQTFGDLLGFNPHCHILVTDGCFYANGMFRVAPPLELKRLEAIFRHKVFCMLIARGKISREMIVMLSTWRHSGFHVFCGNRIQPKEDKAMETLSRYISGHLSPRNGCSISLRIISSIEDQEVIKTILQYLGIWTIRSKPTAKAHALPVREYATDDSCPTDFPVNTSFGDPDYSWDA
ncbi:MAG: transposase [Syntrophales bacterium]